ncbi:MAG: terminase [Pseudomonas sp.]|nr:terminase [Pseudomonas sp.]MDZ4190385.1 terminase [Pseudomonas sp.]
MSQQARFSEAPVKLTPKQANIYVWGWQANARFRDAVCGRRFGKTFLGKAEMRRAARLAVHWGVSFEDEIWYAAPTQKQARRVFWRRLKQAIPESWRACKPNETDMLITLKSGHLIRCVGLENYDDLRGSGLFFVLVDEWADCKYAAWEEVLRPMLSTCQYTIPGVGTFKGGHALRIGTPKGFNHCYDTYRDGQEGGEPDHKSWQYSSLAGGNVPAEELEAARRTMDPRTFRQEYDASFENYSGVVYYTFDRRQCSTTERIKPAEALHIGMDFNVMKMSAVVFVVRDGLPLALDEFHDVRDTPDMIEKIQARFHGHGIAVYPDASGQNTSSKNASESDLSLLKKAGFTVVVNSTNPSVKDRVNSLNAMFLNTYGERRLKVNIDQCPKLTQCLERQTYTDKGEPDKDPKKGHDHMNDAAGYFIVKRYPINQRTATATTLRI